MLRKPWFQSKLNKLSIFDPYYIEERSIYMGITKCLPYFKGTCLDLGCGEQPYRDLIKQNISKYIGLDIRIDALKKNNEINISGNFFDLPFKDRGIDTVLSTQTLEMAPKPIDFLREVHRVLNIKGIFVLSAAQTWPVWSKLDYYRFTWRGLEYLLSESGFRVLKIHPRGGFWVMMSQMLNAYIHSTTAGANQGNPILNLKRQIIDGFKKILMIFIALIGPSFDVLDKKKFNSLNTLGYIVVAEKI